MADQRDAQGRPYITLSQFLKFSDVTPSGGEAKAMVRQGGVRVNGEHEDRPGRKLYAGDKVSAGGKELVVELGK